MTDLTVPVARALMGEWRLALAAERKSPKTIALYLDAVGRYLAWTEARDLPPMRRTSLQTWIADMLDSGRSPSTARIRQQAVRRYVAWLLAVGHLNHAPFQGMTSPKLDQPVVDPLTVAQVRALLHTCQPEESDDPAAVRSLRHVRDEAIIRLMTETGIRLSEVIALTAGDLDLDAGLALSAPPRRPGRHRWVPTAPPPPHRRPPLARRRRFRVRPHGHGRLDPGRDAHPLHPRRRLRTRRRRGQKAQPRSDLSSRGWWASLAAASIGC